MRAVALALLAGVMVSGCAASVERAALPTASAAAATPVPEASSRKIVLNVSGSEVSTGSEDWEPFKGEWRAAMAAATAARQASFSSQEGQPRPTGEPGTLVAVYVNDYRYLTPGARFGFGIMTGNAYIDSNIRILDLENGGTFSEESYNTSSSAWEGAFSAMTDKQVRAICDEVVAQINPR